MTLPEPLVSIGIVTWNSERHMLSCLEGLRVQDYPHLELLVVDNASSDRSAELVRRNWPSARLIQNARNEGFCRAHNQAIGLSQGDYYLALNPDVQLLPGFVERLVRALEERPVFGSAMGKMWQCGQEDPPLIDGAGLFLDRRRHQFLRGRGQPDWGQYDVAEEVFGADGAAPLHRRTMLEDVKIDGQYFDEAFFAYMEDVDLAWRERLFGWKCWYEPAAVARHERSFHPGHRRGVPAELRRMAVKNRYLMLVKNEGREEWRRDWWRIGLYDLGIWAYILLFERSSCGALPMLREQWAKAVVCRRTIWGRARAEPRERLSWFRWGASDQPRRWLGSRPR